MNWGKETDRIARLAVKLVLNKKHKPKYVLNPRFIKRHDIRGRLKKEVFETFENKCDICGDNRNLIVHHDIPLYRGGQNDISNLQLVCEACHAKIHEYDKIVILRMAYEAKMKKLKDAGKPVP